MIGDAVWVSERKNGLSGCVASASSEIAIIMRFMSASLRPDRAAAAAPPILEMLCGSRARRRYIGRHQREARKWADRPRNRPVELPAHMLDAAQTGWDLGSEDIMRLPHAVGPVGASRLYLPIAISVILALLISACAHQSHVEAVKSDASLRAWEKWMIRPCARSGGRIIC